MTGEADNLPAAAGEGLPQGADQSRAVERLDEIRQYRLRNRVKYYADEAVLAEERRLLAGLDGQPAEAGSADQRRPGDLVPLMPLAEWSKAVGPDGDRDSYRRVVSAANDVLRFAGEDAAGLELSFSALPQNVRAAGLWELVDRRPVAIDPLPSSDMDAILRDPPNAELAREWGSDAPRNFALVRERLWRVIDRLSDSDAVAFIGWHGRLPPAASAALHRRIAG